MGNIPGNIVAGIAAACCSCAPMTVHAQQQAADYPKKPVRIVVGQSPGDATDVIARLLAQKLSERPGMSVIVENRPGGGNVTAMNIVAQAAADGYTLLCVSSSFMLVGAMKRVPYDLRKAYEPVAPLTAQSLLLVVSSSLPIASVKELIAYAKGKPDALSYGSAGVGTLGHIAMERFKSMAGAGLVHVAYKGASLAMIDLLAGQIQAMMVTTTVSAPHVKSGKVRGLAVSGLRRMQSLPDVPTVAEAGVPGFNVASTYNIFAPAGTPRPILLIINRLVSAYVRSPQMAQRLAADGSELAEPLTPDQFKAQFAREYAEMEKQAKELNLQIF